MHNCKSSLAHPRPINLGPQQQMNNLLFKKFQSQQSAQCIFIHRLTCHQTLDELIILADKTRTFTLDTQYNNVPSLIQIQFHLVNRPWIILLIEVTFLRSKLSVRLRDERKEQKFQNLFKRIFSSNKHIYSWGNAKTKLVPFVIYNLFSSYDLDQPQLHNVQNYFTKWYASKRPRSLSTRLNDVPTMPTLQTGILLTFNEWLDVEMQLYAINNCLAISKLMFHILQEWPTAIDHQNQMSKVIDYNGRKIRQTAV